MEEKLYINAIEVDIERDGDKIGLDLTLSREDFLKVLEAFDREDIMDKFEPEDILDVIPDETIVAYLENWRWYKVTKEEEQ